MILLTKLLLAHLAGDFILQSDQWVQKKELHKLRSWQFYIHVAIHWVLIMLLVWDIDFLLPALIIALSHGIIDTIKIFFQKDKTKRRWFFIDQSLHLLVIICISWWYGFPFSLEIFNSAKFFIIVTAIVLLTNPSSVIIKILISPWRPIALQMGTGSLPDAGKVIGILERLFILAFILTGHWEGIGFLLAAKSVFRFGDLKEAHDRTLTEYVLIGTLLSFGIAIGTGLTVVSL